MNIRIKYSQKPSSRGTIQKRGFETFMGTWLSVYRRFQRPFFLCCVLDCGGDFIFETASSSLSLATVSLWTGSVMSRLFLSCLVPSRVVSMHSVLMIRNCFPLFSVGTSGRGQIKNMLLLSYEVQECLNFGHRRILFLQQSLSMLFW